MYKFKLATLFLTEEEKEVYKNTLLGEIGETIHWHSAESRVVLDYDVSRLQWIKLEENYQLLYTTKANLKQLFKRVSSEDYEHFATKGCELLEDVFELSLRRKAGIYLAEDDIDEIDLE